MDENPYAAPKEFCGRPRRARCAQRAPSLAIMINLMLALAIVRALVAGSVIVAVVAAFAILGPALATRLRGANSREELH